jgi:hypothetical protein
MRKNTQVKKNPQKWEIEGTENEWFKSEIGVPCESAKEDRTMNR